LTPTTHADPPDATDHRLACALLLCGLLTTTPARADSAAALCALLPKGSALPTALRACLFSQRQGFISVQLAGGTRHEFSPQAAPGAFADAQGRPVQRFAGLGKRGQQFRLADGSTLRVLWGSGPLKTTLALQGIRFSLASANQGSVNTLVVTPAGLAIDDRPQRQEIDGTVSSAELADLDGDGSHLVQRFPIYRPGDANASPSGGERALFYRLARGEAGWLLQLDKSVDSR